MVNLLPSSQTDLTSVECCFKARYLTALASNLFVDQDPKVAGRKRWGCPMTCCPKARSDPFDDPRDLWRHLNKDCESFGGKTFWCFSCEALEDIPKAMRGPCPCCKRPSRWKILPIRLSTRCSTKAKSPPAQTDGYHFCGTEMSPGREQIPSASEEARVPSEFYKQPGLQAVTKESTLEPVSSIEILDKTPISHPPDYSTVIGCDAIQHHDSWKEDPYSRHCDTPSPITPTVQDGQFSPTAISKCDPGVGPAAPHFTSFPPAETIPKSMVPKAKAFETEWTLSQAFNMTHPTHGSMSPLEKIAPLPLPSEAPDSSIFELPASTYCYVEDMNVSHHHLSAFETNPRPVGGDSMDPSYPSPTSPFTAFPASSTSPSYQPYMANITDLFFRGGNSGDQFYQRPAELPDNGATLSSSPATIPASSLSPEMPRPLRLRTRRRPVKDEFDSVMASSSLDSQSSSTVVDRAALQEEYQCDFEGCDWMPKQQGKTENWQRYLRKHRSTHNPTIYFCEVCPMGFNRKDNRDKHRREIHLLASNPSDLPIEAGSHILDDYGESSASMRPRSRKRRRTKLK